MGQTEHTHVRSKALIIYVRVDVYKLRVFFIVRKFLNISQLLTILLYLCIQYWTFLNNNYNSMSDVLDAIKVIDCKGNVLNVPKELVDAMSTTGCVALINYGFDGGKLVC